MTEDGGRSASKDEEFSTLLNEIRILLPGVEVLFAFLLTVPFTERFRTATLTQRSAYFVAFMSASTATILLIAPSVYHRIRWREAHKEDVLLRSNRLAVIGTAFLASSIIAVVFVVTDVLFGSVASASIAALVAVLTLTLWYGLAVRDRSTGGAPRTARPRRET